MIKQRVMILARHALHNKGLSFINILGFAIGIATSILIILYIRYEVNYDRFHENYEHIYQVDWNIKLSTGTRKVPVTPGALSKALLQDIPGIISSTRIRQPGNVLITVEHDNKKYYEKNGLLAECSFWEIFTFPLLQGNPRTALKAPFSIVLTEKLAKKYFPDEEPMGKTIRYDKQFLCRVTGIVKDPPPDSYLKFDYLLSLVSADLIMEKPIVERWQRNIFHTYILLNPHKSLEEVNSKIHNLPRKYLGENSQVYLSLKPYSSLHLNEELYSIGETNDKTIIYVLTIIAAFTLGISSANFMNLSSLTAARREKEVGIRKVVGASRTKLMTQFLAESVITTLIAAACALVLVKLMLPQFNYLVGKNLKMSMLTQGMIPLEIAALVLAVGLISGCYLALYLSSLHPVRVLRGISKGGSKKYLFKKVLVTFQIFISVLLIIMAIIIHLQINYLKEMDWGINKENIFFTRFNNLRPERIEKYRTFKNELLRIPGILNASLSDNLPLGIHKSIEIKNEGGGSSDVFTCFDTHVDYNFFDTYGISLKQGRNFSKAIRSDRKSCIVNEKLVKTMGWQDNFVGASPIGEKVVAYGTKFTVIGVINDIKFQGLFPVQPLMLRLHQNKVRRNFISVKITPTRYKQVLNSIESKFYEFFPDDLFDFKSFDSLLDNFLDLLEKIYILASSLSLLAIFISVLGLFAMASYTTRQRAKEIGLRKVLGANASKIVMLFLKEYFKIFAIANLAAWPCAYLLARQVLQGLTYRVIIHWWVFPLAGLISLAIGLLTITSQSIKAAQTNPVDTLKYE